MESFKPLRPEEKQRLISQAQAFEASVYFKFPDSAVFKTQALPTGSKRLISCPRPVSLAIHQSNKPVTLNFVLNTEIYFLVTVINIDQKKIHFNIDTDIFHLARRKNRRIKIPHDYEAHWMIKRLGGQMAFLRGILTDISDGGCRVALNTEQPLVMIDQSIEGSLKLGSRLPIEVQGKVVYHKLHVRKEHKQIFGIQYKDLADSVEKKIQSTMLDLERELFLRILE